VRILIIKLGALGDILRTTCILRGLKEKYKDCKISWLTKEEGSVILQNNNLIDDIYTNYNNLGKFDLVISLDEEACDIATKIRKEELVGCYLNGGKKVYTSNSVTWFDMGLISKFGKEKANELKKSNTKTFQNHLSNMLDVESEGYIFNLTKKEKDFSLKFAKKHNLQGTIIGLNTGAGRRWELKKINVNKTVELAERLVKELNVQVILFGGPEEKERNKEILKKSGVEIIDAGCDNTLRNFAALIDLCDIFITSDTLAMHLGIALRKKVIAFFGPTSAAEIDLYGKGRKIIADSDCYCCYKKKIEEGIYCTDKIEVNELFEAVRELK
tara:strand:- start:924 stop:1907 length:984 start_codon:yes stop_codon:yes gene_type:complete